MLRLRLPFVFSEPITALRQSETTESMRIETRTSFKTILLREIEKWEAWQQAYHIRGIRPRLRHHFMPVRRQTYEIVFFVSSSATNPGMLTHTTDDNKHST